MMFVQGPSSLFKDVARKDVVEGLLYLGASIAMFLVALIISFIARLGIEKEMFFSFIRPICQLGIMGFFLQFLFSHKNLIWISLPYLFMVVVAAYTAGQRAKHFPHSTCVAGTSILIGTSITLVFLAMLKVFPLTPHYMIPVIGIVVGRAMTVTGITLNRVRDDFRLQTNLIEVALALGATPRQASINQVRRALVIALAPLLDSAKSVGLVSLPGAMAGMILAGAAPLHVVLVQVVVMNTLLCASFLSSVVSTYFTSKLLFTNTYQLESSLFIEE